MPAKGGLADIFRGRVFVGEVQDGLIVAVEVGQVPGLFDNGNRVEPLGSGCLPEEQGVGVGGLLEKIPDFVEGLGANPEAALELPESVLLEPAPQFLAARDGSAVIS